MGNALCGTDIYSKLMKEYGSQFVQLILAEKAKTAVNQRVGDFRLQVDSLFNGFTTQTNQQITEKTGIIRNYFEQAKAQINSRIPGGISLIEQAKNQPIEQLLGFTDIMNKVNGLATNTVEMVKGKHIEAQNFIETTKNNTLTTIDQGKPQIPLFSRLPESLQKMALDRGEQELKKDIQSNNSKILGALSQQLNLPHFQSILGGLNPTSQLDNLVQMAQGGFMGAVQQLLGLGGAGGLAAGVGSMLGGSTTNNALGGFGGSIGALGQQALNGIKSFTG